MKRVFLLVFFSISSMSWAAKYYVSSTEGSDSNNGLTSEYPWKSVAKVNGKTFLPGDSILFRKGDVWRETLTIPSSGNALNYITFGTYGSGNKPKILGSAEITTWTNYQGNVWQSTNTVSNPQGGTYPGTIFFKETNGGVSWGNSQKSSTGVLTAEYDWVYSSGYIYIYSPTDPNIRYSGVEVAQRQWIIYLNNKQYITIDGLEIQFACRSGTMEVYPTSDLSGLIIKNCFVSYMGTRGDVGSGILALHSDMLIQNNVVHDSGRRNIDLASYGNGFTTDNIIVENNVLYNGYHTTGIDMSEQSCPNKFNNIIFRNNYIYDDPNVAVPSNWRSAGIWVQGDGGGSGTINNVYIYNNILKGSQKEQVSFENVQSAFIYNNTFYGANQTIRDNVFMLKFTYTCTNIVIKNNIFYGNTNYNIIKTAPLINVSSNSDEDEIEADYNLYYQIDSRTPIISVNSRDYYMDDLASIKTVLGWETNSPAPADPRFISSSDYHLQPGSPAIGAGIAIPGITTDFEGNNYTNPPNIGCFADLGPTNIPVYVSSVVANATPYILEITYNLNLANILPVTSAFTVRVNSAIRTVSSVAIAGDKVRLTLSSPVVYGDIVTVAYTRPAINPLQSTAGGQATTIAAQAVTNNVSPVVPVYVSSVIANTTPTILEMTYSLSLANIVPAISAFTVLVNSVNRTVSSVAIAGGKVRLTLSSPVAFGEVVTVAYTRPASNTLQTASGAQAVSIGAQPVTNNVGVANSPPVIITNYNQDNYSGFVGEIDASASYDVNQDYLTFEWTVPLNIEVSSTTASKIQYLAPLVQRSETFEFVLKISDGKSVQSKNIAVTILPYKPGFSNPKIIDISASNFDGNNYPDNIIDNDLETLWTSISAGQWLSIELEKPFVANYFEVAFQKGQRRASYFDIYGSKDDLIWDPILLGAASCNFAGGFQIFDVPETIANPEYLFIKLIGQTNSEDSWNNFSEFKIFGTPQTEEIQITVYPNPARDNFNISIHYPENNLNDNPVYKSRKIRVYNISGILVSENLLETGNNEYQIPINFKSGIYFVQMVSDGLTVSACKLIVIN